MQVNKSGTFRRKELFLRHTRINVENRFFIHTVKIQEGDAEFKVTRIVFLQCFSDFFHTLISFMYNVNIIQFQKKL